MNFKPSITSPIKPLLLVLAVAVLTVFFVYSQMMGHSSLVSLWFLALITLTLLSMRYSAIESPVIKMLLLSMLIYISLKYGIFFLQAKASNLIALYAAVLLPVIFFYPRLMTYLNLALIFFFSSSSFGLRRYDELVAFLGGVFARGAEKYAISYVNILLILTAMSIMFQKIINKNEDKDNISCNLYKYFWIFNALFFIYMLWGITLGININNILSMTGVINITNMGILIFIIHRMFRTEKDFEQLKMYFLYSMLLRGVWAIARFIFFGGDPRNPYSDFRHKVFLNVSIFDIGDGLIQCIALFYALFILLNKGDRILPKKEALFYWMIVFVGLFNIVFSYRRTGWFGLLIAFVWLMPNLRSEKRIAAGFIAIILGVTIFTGIAANRFTTAKKGSEGIFTDIKGKSGDITFKTGRFIELKMAWETAKNNILFGVGPWGKYKVTKKGWNISSEFVHSSFIFMLLKMGVIGCLVFGLIFAAFVRFWLTQRKRLPMHVRGFAEASFAGFLFFIPTILFGNPIVEYRPMALLGFCLAIPYIVCYLNKGRTEASLKKIIT